MQHWVIDQHASPIALACSRVARVVQSIGAEDRTAFAGSILALARDLLPVQHCSVFAHETDRSPRLLSASSIRNHRVAFDAASRYVSEYFRKDSVQTIVAKSERHVPPSKIVVHHHTAKEIDDSDYRDACYRTINIPDRVATLIRSSSGSWIAVNLYKDHVDGPFSEAELDIVRGLAPMVSQAAERHYAADFGGESGYRQSVDEDLCRPELGLTQREREVVLRLLDGLTTHAIAADLKISATTVVTYRERAYGKLGVSSRRELFASILRRRARTQ